MLSPAKVQVAAGTLYPANPELRISDSALSRYFAYVTIAHPLSASV